MSGGSFDYAYCRVSQFADELKERLDNFDKVDEWDCKPNYFNPDVLAKLREIEEMAVLTSKLMKEAEWLYSGDTGEGTFMSRVTKILSGVDIH